jgi:hypothetical protein
MAFLSLILLDSANRWANIIVGAAFAVLWLASAVSAARSAYWGGALTTFSAGVATALIVWYAGKSKQRK